LRNSVPILADFFLTDPGLDLALWFGGEVRPALVEPQ
jgi:hypothetical protein